MFRKTVEDIYQSLKVIGKEFLFVLAFLIISLHLKGLYHYIRHSSEYLVTYKFDDYYSYLTKMIENRVNLFAAVTAIISSVISLALPLSINQVANSLKEYNDKEITKMFFNETIFIRIRSVLVLLFFSLALWFFCNDPLKVSMVLISFVILTLYYLYLFLNRVIEYITSADDIVYDYYLNTTNKLFDDPSEQ